MATVSTGGETVTVTVPVVGRRLVFADTFTGLDLSRWNVRDRDYSKNNYAFYVPANVTVQTDGLHLTAKRQTGLTGQPITCPYTSGFVDTIGKQSQMVGRWEITAKLPSFKGAWPAIWLRCDSTLGEIDIMEAVGGDGGDVETVHQSTNGDMDKSGYEYKPSGLDLTQFHVYALERDPDGSLRWYVDGVLTRSRKPTDLDNQGQPMTWLAGPTFASPLHLLINLQVGGSMPRSFGLDVDATSALPGDMVIRSVRIYQ